MLIPPGERGFRFQHCFLGGEGCGFSQLRNEGFVLGALFMGGGGRMLFPAEGSGFRV